MSTKRASVTKRACDGCKIRKIRCGGGNPCPACTNARIKCTYIRVQQPRGPQRIRSTTKYLIDQAQRGDVASSVPWESAGVAQAFASPPKHDLSEEESRIPINIIASPLYIYHVRMYPVWPIVDVEGVIARLKQDQNPDDENIQEVYALATAVAAATIAQLRLGQNTNASSGANGAEKPVTADTFAAESLRARNSSGYRAKVNLNNVRTSFFLHVYYENQCSGGSESLLYLREAISLAQMMQLHRESSYARLLPEEQQIRRRVLWLLFVTERGVCILHKLPTVLRTNISTPDLDINDEPQVLPAFLKLLNLFRLFEQSKMFDVIEDDEPAALPEQSHNHNLDRRFLQLLQDNLQDGSTLLDHISDVQKADLCVTRHWMRMILWRFSAKNSPSTSPSFPVMVAKDLLSIVSQLPRTAIEAHGLGMELKLYEIANSLADAVMNLTLLPSAPSAWDGETRPSSILARLHSILSTFRGGGGNKELAEILYKKMAEAQSRSGPTLCPSIKTAQRPVKRKTSVMVDDDQRDSQQGGDVYPLWADAAHSTLPGPSSGNASSGGYTTAEYDCNLRTELGAFDESFAGQLWQDYSLRPFGSMFDAYMPTSLAGAGGDARLSPGFAGFSPSLPSNSMDMLIGDFISQVPGETFFENEYMGSSVPLENPIL